MFLSVLSNGTAELDVRACVIDLQMVAPLSPFPKSSGLRWSSQ